MNGLLYPQIQGGLDPKNLALLQAGLGIMAAGPGRSFGQAVGMGGMQGVQAYQQAMEQQQKRQMLMAEMAMKKQLQDAQIENYKSQADQRKQASELQSKQQSWLQDPANLELLNQDPVRALAMSPGASMADITKLLEARDTKKAAMQQRLDELKLRLEDRGLDRESREQLQRESQQLRRDLFNFSSSQSRDLAQQRMDMQRELAQQRIDAADRARQDKVDLAQGKTDEAKRRVSANLEALNEYYDELTKLGASIDVSKGGAANISSRIRASGAGQMLGGAFGTEEQSYRNKINQMRPLLLQEIRQATQMGARGLDSNKELEFYLQAATDPARDIQSNKAAIAVLEEAYGLGSRVRAPEDSKQRLRSEFKGSEKQGVRRIATDAEYNALPSGTEFIGPDGKRRRKP
jgi:hypothetical protein